MCFVSMTTFAERWLMKEMDFLRNDSTFRVSCTYNTANQLVLQSTHYLSGGVLENYAYMEQTFSQANRTSKSDYKWCNNQWTKCSRTEWEYRADGLLSSQKQYDGVNNLWVVQNQIIYLYAANSSLCLEQRHLLFDGNKWEAEMQVMFEYEAEQLIKVNFNVAENGLWKAYGDLFLTYDNRLISTIFREQVADSMQNKSKTLYIYTQDGQLKYEKQQLWVDDSWQDECKLESTTFDNKQSTIFSDWGGQYWSNLYKIADQYDEKFLINRSFSGYDYHMWLPYYTTKVTINAVELERSVSTAYEFFGGNVSDVRQDYLPLQDKYFFTYWYAQELHIKYFTIDDTSTQQFYTKNDIIVYPNPSPDGFYYIESVSDNIKWRVYNVQGFIMATGGESVNRVIDLTSCPKGVYIVKILIDGETYTTKLIKVN